LLEKILSAFESSAQPSSRIDDEVDDEKLPKKIEDLTDMVKNLRSEIAELRADQNSIQVSQN
jgi:hypothetical protein